MPGNETKVKDVFRIDAIELLVEVGNLGERGQLQSAVD